MSDYLAVGGVTAVLRSLLTTALTSGGPSTLLGSSSSGVTALSPDLIKTGPDEQPQVNIFMYYASLNPALRNLGMPSMSAQGGKLSNPPLALNLHYLVTAYGSNQFDPEILLGWAMQVFHETPVVPRAIIQAALTGLLAQVNPENQLIAGSTLPNQVEHIRITPEALTTEEIYRLWTAFQTNYRPTTSYQVSVVVIQDTQTFTSNLPVQRRTVTALPVQPPVIDAVTPSSISAGQVLTITGSNFLGDSPPDTLVSFDFAPGVAPDTIQGNCIRITLPVSLLAGTRTVRVLRTITYPGSTVPHPGFSSSPTRFQLIPAIQGASPFAAKLGTPFTATLLPTVGSTQQATLHIGDSAISIDDRPTTGPAFSTTLIFPIPATLATGLFPLHIEIDGAKSKLTPNSSGQLLPQVQVSP
ncbi:MAG TPA: Pvc16 family protein [Acidobacteriaceae bacterium]